VVRYHERTAWRVGQSVDLVRAYNSFIAGYLLTSRHVPLVAGIATCLQTSVALLSASRPLPAAARPCPKDGRLVYIGVELALAHVQWRSGCSMHRMQQSKVVVVVSTCLVELRRVPGASRDILRPAHVLAHHCLRIQLQTAPYGSLPRNRRT
jgi:hypothetical protein